MSDIKSEKTPVPTAHQVALLDENDVFVGMVDRPDPAAITDRYLPQITACDLPSGKYIWIAEPEDKGNPYGGAFHSIELLNRIEAVHAAADAVAARKARNAVALPSKFQRKGGN